MGRLIDEQAAIDALKKAYWDTNIQSAKSDPCIVDAMTDWAIRQIKALPSAQPEHTEQDVRDSFNEGYRCGMEAAQPEIIRCKDCKYGVDYYHDGSCYCAKPGYELLYFEGSWEFYCANAERRTDG